MRAILPGRPEPGLQALCTGYWAERRLVAYITGSAFVILDGDGTILQTVYEDDTSSLTAIAFDETFGKIATSSGRDVHIYKPYGQDEDALRWSLQSMISLKNREVEITTLSWGTNAELLVGSLSLTLYSTSEQPKIVWKKKIANVAKFAQFSYDSAYIVSTGEHDRLAKVWRRLAFGADDVRFDFSYLSHPSTITGVHWRRPQHLEQTIDNVLYTVSADNIIRVWATTDPHGLQMLQLWTKIDLQESIHPRAFSPSDVSNIRYVFIIDGKDFTQATEATIQKGNPQKGSTNQALDHLVEVANRSPEICVVLDDHGHMSAWGLENIGCKSPSTKNVFNIAHVNELYMGLSRKFDNESYVQFYNYCNQVSGRLTILIHHFGGSIGVFESGIAELFDPVSRSDRITSKAVWTGHSGPIKKIVRSNSGNAIVSRTDDNECVIWIHSEKGTGTALTRQSIINETKHVHRICVLTGGQFIILLHHDSLSLWDTRSPSGKLLASCRYSIAGRPLCILLLPQIKYEKQMAHVATITTKMKGIVWEVRLPNNPSTHSQTDENVESFIREYSRFDLGDDDDLAYVLPVDPAGSPAVISGFLDTFARDVAISYTHSGLLRSWTAKVDSEKGNVDWLMTSSVETGVQEPALVSASSIRKATLVNSTRSDLTIWDTRGGQLEYSQSFEAHETIQDLDWTSTPDDQSILAVGFPFRVLLLAQMRYDYIDKGPAWSSIQEINIRELTTHPIGDSTWLGGGNLVIGSGHQLFVYDKTIDVSGSLQDSLRLPRRKLAKWDLFEVVTRLNGPLPIFHPQFLSQCILAGKTALVQRIILTLHKTLKYHVEDEAIDNLLGIDANSFYNNDEVPSKAASHKESKSSAFADFSEDDDSETLTENVAAAINEKLTTVAIPQLSGHEQIHLADIIECAAIVEKQRRSLDHNAARFMLLFRQHALRRGRAGATNLSWREINWAYHSNSQEILVDVVSRQFHGKMLWEHARESGIFMWITDSVALKAQFEVIARNEYTKSDMKNPIDCSLFYLALRKKTVLQGLWRMAGWNREQGATQKLLANNFQDPKWRTAAMKNAFALLGKRRFEYAAAFFLLADHLDDAVNVCLNQLKDLQLAIAITRVYEGDQGPLLSSLLQEKVLPLAAREGNRYLASWAFWMLHHRDMAVLTLVQPIYTLISPTPNTENGDEKLCRSSSPLELSASAKSFLTDDPALVILYGLLRHKTLQTLRGSTRITPRVEWEFVLHNSRLYDRMGCDLLALDLVRNWEFLNPIPVPKEDAFGRGSVSDEAGNKDARKLLRRRSSLVVDDSAEGGNLSIRGLLSPGFKRPQPSVFEEPESSSLLDNFGF